MGLFNFGNVSKYSFKAFLTPFEVSNIHHSCLGNGVIAMLRNTNIEFVSSIYRQSYSAGSFAGLGRAILFNRGRYIVGTFSNGIYYSDDGGGVFSLSDAPVGVGTLTWGLAGSESVICAMTGTGMKYSLNNGNNYLSSAVINPAPWGGSVNARGPNCLKWFSELGLFVVVGGKGGVNYVAHSVDGNNWVQHSFPVSVAGDFLQSVAVFRNKIYVAGHQGGVYQLNTDFTGVKSVNSATSLSGINGYHSSDLFVFNDELYLVTGNDSSSVTGSISVLGGAGFNMLYTPQGAPYPLFTAHDFNGALHVVGRSSFVRSDAQLPV